MSDTFLNSQFGSYQIKRIPHRKKETLRAWDAADIQLLDTLFSKDLDITDGVLLVNDNFAALSVSLNRYSPISWSDSWISHQALRENLNLNSLHEVAFKTIDSLHLPKVDLGVVLIKIPKSMALFEYQLLRLKPLLHSNTVVLVAGMVKYMPKKVWSLLESIIGGVNTHLTSKKAKLIEVTVNVSLVCNDNPYPISWGLEDSDLMLKNHANVFSREHLDVGTRFFLEHCPAIEEDQSVIDLGCGNGVIGLSVLSKYPETEMLFADESYMAIASVKDNVKQLPKSENIKFHCGDGLLKVKKQSANIILCNPPFHQHHSTGETMALTMFSQASRVLKKYGELWIVGNRHLAYHTKLGSWFMDVTLIASNKNFVILKASRPKDFKGKISE